jgi:hypothetical protein
MHPYPADDSTLEFSTLSKAIIRGHAVRYAAP